MGNPQWRQVGHACLVMHTMDRLVKKDHRELSAGQCGVEFDAAPFEIGLPEKPQAGRGFDGEGANRPGAEPMMSRTGIRLPRRTFGLMARSSAQVSRGLRRANCDKPLASECVRCSSVLSCSSTACE